MDSENISRRQDELNRIKKGLKDWEHGFFRSHKRKPTIKDIQERPKVERVYKDYHSKKKQLRLLSEEGMDSQSLSQPITFDSQQQQRHTSTSQETKGLSPASSPSSQPLSPSQKRRRGSQASVEYIRSPSHRLSRIKYVDQLERPTTSLDFGTKPSTSSGTSAPGARNTSTDADSFWLSNSQESPRTTGPSTSDVTTTASDPSSTTSNFGNNSSSFFSADNINGTSLNINRSTSSKKKKKKNAAALEQKLLGHLIWKPRDTLSPALKAERDSSSQPTTPTTDSKMSIDSQASTSTPPPPDITPTTTTTSTQEDTIDTAQMITDEILSPSSPSPYSTTIGKTVGDLKLDGLVIAEHEQDPFRHFDPNLMNHLEDPDSFVMPGLFASARARSTIMAPMMEDDGGRYKRILEALEQGTLGEKRRDDDQMDDMDEDLKRFIAENTDTFAEHIDTTEQDQPPPYRKKFTQKRQTRLHKFKYVETSPSGL